MVKIEKTDGKLTVESPYNPDFPYAAKKLGGKWSAPLWVFDERDEERVRDLCASIYGTDGTVAAGDLVTVRVTVDNEWAEITGSLFLFGRQVARAYGRDSGAKIGGGVVVLDGNFRSGGSVKNWRTVAPKGLVFELRDVPRAAVEKNGVPSDLTVEVIDSTIDRAALLAERDKLTARIEEIDNMLKEAQNA